jgi:hypothetical protein
VSRSKGSLRPFLFSYLYRSAGGGRNAKCKDLTPLLLLWKEDPDEAQVVLGENQLSPFSSLFF